MKLFLIHQILLNVLASGLALADSWQSAASLALGGGIMTLNFAILGMAWSMISRKKLVALNVLIIVSKYTLLAVVLYQILSLSWIRPVAFMVGISMFVLAAVLTGLYLRFRTDLDDGQEGRKEQWLQP